MLLNCPYLITLDIWQNFEVAVSNEISFYLRSHTMCKLSPEFTTSLEHITHGSYYTWTIRSNIYQNIEKYTWTFRATEYKHFLNNSKSYIIFIFIIFSECSLTIWKVTLIWKIAFMRLNISLDFFKSFGNYLHKINKHT